MTNFFNFHFFKEVESTNIEAKKKFSQTRTNIALFSHNQTNGKGRSNNVWLSKLGDLTCSFLIKEKFLVNKVGQLNILACVSLILVLKKIYKQINFKIKWPNDIYVNEKKIAGILIESKVSGNFLEYFILGFGLNIVSHPKGLLYDTTSISKFSNELEPKKIFLNLADTIEGNLKLISDNKFSILQNIWIKNSKDFGKEIKIKQNNKFFSGRFISLNKFGSMVLETQSGNKIIFSYGETLL